MAYACMHTPDLAAKYAPMETAATSACATCGAVIRAGEKSLTIDQIETPTFTRHAENLRFSRYVCLPCGWFYGHSKYGGSHRSWCACGNSVAWPVLRPDKSDRPTWWDVLRSCADEPAHAQFCGLLTVDTKPRLWPEVRLSSVDRPRLYVHAPHMDISEMVPFDFLRVWNFAPFLRRLLDAKISKRALWRGWDDPKAFRRAPVRVRMLYQSMMIALRTGDAVTRGSYAVALLAAFPSPMDAKWWAE